MTGYHLCAGLLEIQGLSSGGVTFRVLQAVGNGQDQAIISRSGQREQKQTDRELALDSRQKGPSNFQIV